MNYFQGDIVNKGNLTYKDTNSIDLRLNGHPVIIPVDIDIMDEFHFFFPMTSQIQKYNLEPERYFIVAKGNGTGLKKTSMIDLKYVYKYRNQAHKIWGNLPEKVFSELMQKFHDYNKKHIDDDLEDFLRLSN